MTRIQRRLRVASMLLWLAGCSSDSDDNPPATPDAGSDAASTDADAAAVDAGTSKDASTPPDAQTIESPVRGTAEIAPWGFDLAGMKESVRPGNSFYQYANGTWLEENLIPDDRVAWGSFDALALEAEVHVQALVAQPAEDAAAGSDGRKVREYYAAFLDTDRIEAEGLKPLAAGLEAIAGAKTHEDIAKLMGRSELGRFAPLSVDVAFDDKEPNRYVISVYQGGLGLPDRDYYLGEMYADLVKAYEEHIARMLTLVGTPEAESGADAAAVVELETQIADKHWPIAMRRDRDATYNPRTRAELLDQAKGFPWEVMLAEAGLPDQDAFIVAELSAVVDLASAFSSVPVATWVKYLTYHYVRMHASFLPSAIDKENFAFFGTTLNGQPTARARDRRAISAVNSVLGEAIGKLYVAEHFPEAHKKQMVELVENLRDTFSERIKGLSWMTAATKEAAQKKLDTFLPKIGYPDKWKDYSKLEVKAGDAFGNLVRARVWAWEFDVARLGKPTDRSEWFMSPQTVNAYYNSVFNEIVFPAAILQPPFFDPNADPAVNYGGIGAVIGHEMGHGFDDQGAKSDENGVLRTWWQPEDEAAFSVLVDKLVAQYDTYEVLPDLFVNGRLTVGENIGDLGGLTVAYYAYRASLQGKTAPVLNGLTGDQRFFLGWAQVWRQLRRDESLRTLVMSDSHSPNPLRVDGVVRNIDEFYEAFGVKPDDALWLDPEARVHIW
jgi:putative endopeptidase